jgi:hypothetical protein
MEDETELQQKEAQRPALLKEAARVVQSAEAESRTPNAEEDYRSAGTYGGRKEARSGD